MVGAALQPVLRAGGGLAFSNSIYNVVFREAGFELDGLGIRPRITTFESGRESSVVGAHEAAVALETPVLARVVANGSSDDGHLLRVTYDVHQTENLHVYMRFEWREAARLDSICLPHLLLRGVEAIETGDGVFEVAGPDRHLPLREPWIQLRGARTVGVGIKKRPWLTRWNDVGATGYRTLANVELRLSADAIGLWLPGPIDVDAGQTLEMALLIRPVDEPVGDLRREVLHEDPREVVYIPGEEWEHFLSREAEEVWLGPPILGGCPNRPADQLIPRSLGMDILAHRRFSWNNEDLSLWRITGKSIYRDIAVKKAFALLVKQNEYGGWFEGVEFYNLPPRHHQHYHSYTSFVYLIDLYDHTGYQGFLDAALRSKEFWLGPPPANSHSKDSENEWWYRWGGYINAAGYTDERHALNTHASVLMIFSLLWDRVQDEDARRGLENGVRGFKRGLAEGLQRSNGQYLYSLSQLDPRYERPGDPPYIQDQLIPEIENVYTVLSAFRLMVANRVAGDSAVAASYARALSYFWRAYKDGKAYTYRSYPVKTFGLAAGEHDLRFAFALPDFLRDPNNWTSIYRGFSAWVAPLDRKGLLVEATDGALGVESVFLRRDREGFSFAVVNVGPPRLRIPLTVELDEAAQGSAVELIEPSDGTLLTTLASTERDAKLEFELPDLPEGSVAVVKLKSPSAAG